jgi:hypothetical protein
MRGKAIADHTCGYHFPMLILVQRIPSLNNKRTGGEGSEGDMSCGTHLLELLAASEPRHR